MGECELMGTDHFFHSHVVDLLRILLDGKSGLSPSAQNLRTQKKCQVFFLTDVTSSTRAFIPEKKLAPFSFFVDAPDYVCFLETFYLLLVT